MTFLGKTAASDTKSRCIISSDIHHPRPRPSVTNLVDMTTLSAAAFSDLLAQARQGNEAAMHQLVTEYEHEVHTVARIRLGAALRPYVDSIDLVQSVHKSLMIGLQEGKFDISTPQNLIALALTIVRRDRKSVV